jgi:hypothetical protein
LSRPILSLWPYFWRALTPFVMLAVLAFLPGPPYFALAGVGALLLIGVGRSQWWLWRLASQVRRFHTTSKGRIVLHYAPELNDGRDMAALLQQCQVELDDLTARFGFPLRGRVVVFLFSRHQQIGKIFRPHYAGAALWRANAIIIADNYNTQAVRRHEFAHLFSGRWSWHAPALLSEGLSVWLQETWCGRPIDAVALPLLNKRGLKLHLFLKYQFFFADPNRTSCYVLSGSFTGFLIRRYGWQRYRKLYRLCNGVRFRAKFKKCFGAALETAEWQWRNEITVMDILNRRLKRNACS